MLVAVRVWTLACLVCLWKSFQGTAGKTPPTPLPSCPSDYRGICSRSASRTLWESTQDRASQHSYRSLQTADDWKAEYPDQDACHSIILLAHTVRTDIVPGDKLSVFFQTLQIRPFSAHCTTESTKKVELTRAKKIHYSKLKVRKLSHCSNKHSRQCTRTRSPAD